MADFSGRRYNKKIRKVMYNKKGDFMLTCIQVTKESEKFPEIVRLYRAAFLREERVALDLLLETDGPYDFIACYDEEMLCGLTSFVADAETIESNVFVDCQSLTDLHFTSKVKSIGEYLVTDCPNLSVVCFDGCDLTASEMGLFCNIAPELTVYVPENMNEENLNHAENCISWNSSETAVTVTVGTCTHALPEKPDISSLLPDLEPAEADDDPDLT